MRQKNGLCSEGIGLAYAEHRPIRLMDKCNDRSFPHPHPRKHQYKCSRSCIRCCSKSSHTRGRRACLRLSRPDTAVLWRHTLLPSRSGSSLDRVSRHDLSERGHCDSTDFVEGESAIVEIPIAIPCDCHASKHGEREGGDCDLHGCFSTGRSKARCSKMC